MTTLDEPVSVAAPTTLCASLPYQPESAAAARRLVRHAVAAWELDGLLDDSLIIVSELATNAVATGCRRRMVVTVQQITIHSIRISVRDGSRSLPVFIQDGSTDSGAESGRGMAIVHNLTRGNWGVQPEAFGKTVHADLRLRPPL